MVHVVGNFFDRRIFGNDREGLFHIFRNRLAFGDRIGYQNVQNPGLTDAAHNFAAFKDGKLRNVVLAHKCSSLLDSDGQRNRYERARTPNFVVQDLPRANFDA